MILNTTDLEAVRAGTKFVWGSVVRIHDIGRYSFVEYYGREYVNCHPTGRMNDKTTFHVYVDGNSTSTGCGSLESAMIYAIAVGKLEINHARHMSMACLKILELNE